MYIGGSIVLLAIGAILSFAVQYAINGVDLVAVGYILMAAGALGILLSLFINAQRREDRRDLPPR
jgi:pilus assembly protein TadC